jgi:hypothetical protein
MAKAIASFLQAGFLQASFLQASFLQECRADFITTPNVLDFPTIFPPSASNQKSGTTSNWGPLRAHKPREGSLVESRG